MSSNTTPDNISIDFYELKITFLSNNDKVNFFKHCVYLTKHINLSLLKATFCKEFVLPPTELYHSAKLVCLVGAPGIDSRQYGVLAVSPEGLVCYWPSMMYESSPVETETELVGQEFHSLVEFQVLHKTFACSHCGESCT